MGNYNKNDKEKDDGKKIIILIIFAIILLLLITSCSCSSKFFGKLGNSLSDSINGLFNNKQDVKVDDDTNDKETITNQELRFDTDGLMMSLSDVDGRLSFSYSKINPKGFTCETSDADIATCYVSGGHVVVIPKKVGTVQVTLKTTANGKVYEATAPVTITDPLGYIDLSANSGTMNLKETNQKLVSYSLVDLVGNVVVSSSDESVATAEAINGSLIITGYKKGTATITLTVSHKDREYKNTYTIHVVDYIPNNNKPSGGNQGSNSSNNYLKNIQVLNDKYHLDKSFSKNTLEYTIRVAYNEENLSLKAIAELETSRISYKLNDKSITEKELRPLKLKEGANILEIIVTSKDGKSRTYTVFIHKPVRTIHFEYSSYKVYEGIPKDMYYFIEEDGKRINEDINYSQVKSYLTGAQKNSSIEFHDGYITLTAKDVSIQEDTLNIEYNGKKDATKVIFDKYFVSTDSYKYEGNFIGNSLEKDFVLKTNLYIGEISVDTSGNRMSICSTDGKTCTILTLDSEDVSLKYTGGNVGPSSLPFQIQVHKPGNYKIHVSGIAYDREIASFDIEIIAKEMHLVVLDSNGGKFNETDDGEKYEIPVANGYQIDLTNYDEPYKLSSIEDNVCIQWKFIGYSTSIDGEVVYNRTDKNIIENITGNLTLYAIYEKVLGDEEKVDPDTLVKAVWVEHANLFHNEEYFNKYHEDKVIYPSANGSNVITLTNESSKNILVTDMTLKEQNICIANKGCLNMGYIVRYSRDRDADYAYAYGQQNEKYWILNKHEDTIVEGNDHFTSNIKFKTPIELEPNEKVEVTVFWRWEEVDDKLDTLIGNHAAEKLVDTTINDMYRLSIGFHFETKVTSCPE